MATYNHDIQAAVDATSVAVDAGSARDIAAHLRRELAKREVMTDDQDWLASTADLIARDPDAMVTGGPRDFDPEGHRDHLS